ncbi:MAG: hypothetical protein ACI3V3_04325 [Faecousia sp.]
MCIICASAAGVRQPSEAQLRRMFERNPHGAGYMSARGDHVEIHKGFMTFEDFLHAVRYEHFTAEDAVVYHFRISTQAGVGPEMTHPFPLTSHMEDCKLLDVSCPVGVAHNGVIRLTSDYTDMEYSDTAHYVTEFLRFFLRSRDDLDAPDVLEAIRRTTNSRWAILDRDGTIATVGEFINDRGLLFSNDTFRAAGTVRRAKKNNYSNQCDFFDN